MKPNARELTLILLISILSVLPACMRSIPQKPTYEPPRIDCGESTPSEPLPKRGAIPKMPKEERSDEWWRRYVQGVSGVFVAYERRLLGWGASELDKRVKTAECLQRERDAGRIK